MTRLVVDENLSPRLAERLRQDGHDAVHVNEVGLRSAKDPVILAWAARQQRTVVTQDQDFIDHLRDLGAVRPSVVKVVQKGPNGLAGVDAQAARLAHVLPELDRRREPGLALTVDLRSSDRRTLPLEGRTRPLETPAGPVHVAVDAAVRERVRVRQQAAPERGRSR